MPVWSWASWSVGLAIASTALGIAPWGEPGPDPAYPLVVPEQACTTTPGTGGTASCSFVCDANNSGGHGFGQGEFTIQCGTHSCTVTVEGQQGCVIDSAGEVGSCRYQGTGFAECS